MKKAIQLVLGIIAVLAAVGLALWARNNYLSSVTMVTIRVPKTDIPPYTLLRSDMFANKEFPSALQASSEAYALADGDLLNKITTTRLAAGLPVATSLIAKPEDFRLADPALQVLAIPVKAENAVGGQIRIGERVNVYRIVVQDESKINGIAPMATPDASGMVILPTKATTEILPLLDMPNAKVEWVAEVPVINILANGGKNTDTPASKEDSQNGAVKPAGGSSSSSSSNGSASQNSPAMVLVAVNNEQAQAILRLIGTADKLDELIWLSLARADGKSDAPTATPTATPQGPIPPTSTPAPSPTANLTTTPAAGAAAPTATVQP